MKAETRYFIFQILIQNESILVMSLLDEMVSFSKFLSFEEDCLSGRHSMSVKHLYTARYVTRRFGILAFSENLHTIILTTMVINYIIFTIRGGQVV